MDEKVFEALRERVKSEPYAKMLGLELVKVESGYALDPDGLLRRGTTTSTAAATAGLSSHSSTRPSRFASNSSGKIEIALNVSVSYMKAPRRQATSSRPRRSSSTAPAGSATSSSRSETPRAISWPPARPRPTAGTSPLPFL
ncbi:MAG: hypothetical protein MZV70_13005 [Desulfobacterales bacterium]|nr:hypothetical protein [Desulfobacterales bacterium]